MPHEVRHTASRGLRQPLLIITTNNEMLHDYKEDEFDSTRVAPAVRH